MSTVIVRCVFLVAVVLSLLAGIAGGLLRAGVRLPEQVHGAWLGQAVISHAFLMICAFMGTLIGIERAVAVKQRICFATPLASAAAGLLMLAGSPNAAAWLAVMAALAFIAVNVLVLVRQRAAHTALLLIGAVAWLVGNLLFASNAQLAAAAVPWWFSFLVLTIAAERLEMTRLMRRRQGASPALFAIVAAMLLGSAVFAVSAWGGVLYGASLVALAAWLLCFDIARRTVMARGLSRYMAICLLLGYVWLAVAGIGWVAISMGQPCRDVALHALGLGFVFSMMLGHAPVIMPALARVKLLFGWMFYLPLVLLHASLMARLLPCPVELQLLATGAAGNALAILLFMATVAGSAIAWRTKR